MELQNNLGVFTEDIQNMISSTDKKTENTSFEINMNKTTCDATGEPFETWALCFPNTSSLRLLLFSKVLNTINVSILTSSPLTLLEEC